MRVLYVEDDETQAKTVEAILESEEHFCHRTDSGEQAVVLAKRNNYDLIILDIMLPDIDGYEVIERLKAAQVATPCLIQSGFVDFDELLEKLGPGATTEDCLLKPFTKSELLEHLESVRSPRVREKAPGSENEPGSRKPDPESERRQGERVATVKSAEIITSDDRFACVILNLSGTGAAIRLPPDKQPCPAKFRLKIQSEAVHDCELCWSAGDNAGVRFVQPEDSEEEASELLALKMRMKPRKAPSAS